MSDRSRLERVQVHLLEPTRVEDEGRVLDLSSRADVKAGHPKHAST
jgi:hypothetical protein